MLQKSTRKVATWPECGPECRLILWRSPYLRHTDPMSVSVACEGRNHTQGIAPVDQPGGLQFGMRLGARSYDSSTAQELNPPYTHPFASAGIHLPRTHKRRTRTLMRAPLPRPRCPCGFQTNSTSPTLATAHQRSSGDDPATRNGPLHHAIEPRLRESLDGGKGPGCVWDLDASA